MQVHLFCDAVLLFPLSKNDWNQTATEEKALNWGKESQQEW